MTQSPSTDRRNAPETPEQSSARRNPWNQTPEEAERLRNIANARHHAERAREEQERQLAEEQRQLAEEQRQLAERRYQEQKIAKAKSEGRIAPDDREVTHFSKWINPDANPLTQGNAERIIGEQLGQHALFHNNLGTSQQHLFKDHLSYMRGDVNLTLNDPIKVLGGSYPEFESAKEIGNDGAIYFKSIYDKHTNTTSILTFHSPRVYRGLNIKDFNSDGSLKHNGTILPRCIDTRLNPNDDVTCSNPAIVEMINQDTVEKLNRHTFPGCCSNSIVDWVTTGSKKHVDLTVSKFISFSTEVVTPLFYCYTHTGQAGENGGPPGLAGHSGVMISFNPEGLTQFLPPREDLKETSSYFPSTLHFKHTEGNRIGRKYTNDLIARTYLLLASDREVLLSYVPRTKLHENEGGKAYRVSGKYFANKASIQVYVDHILETDLQNRVNITAAIKTQLKKLKSFKSFNDNVMLVATKIGNKASCIQRTEDNQTVKSIHFMFFICVAVPVSQLQSVLTTDRALENLSSNLSDVRTADGKIMLYEFGPPREQGHEILEIEKVKDTGKDQYKIQPIQERGGGGEAPPEEEQEGEGQQ